MCSPHPQCHPSTGAAVGVRNVCLHQASEGGGFISPYAAGARGQAAPGDSMVDVAREYGAARQGQTGVLMSSPGERALTPSMPERMRGNASPNPSRRTKGGLRPAFFRALIKKSRKIFKKIAKRA